MRVYVEIEGMQDVIDEFKTMPDKGKAVLDDAAMAGANYTLPLIQAAIPLNSQDDIHLKNSLKAKKLKKKSLVKSKAAVVVGARSANYGFHLETGHRVQTDDGRSFEVPAKPFIRNTVDPINDKISEVMAEELLRGVGL